MWFMEPLPPRPPSQHRVRMYFAAGRGWQISFLEENGHTALPRRLTFATADKILEIFERWGEHRTSEEARSDLEREIEMGRSGGVWLILTEEQYRKLKPDRRPAPAATPQTTSSARP